MLFSNPDYPVFLIAVVVLYALARTSLRATWAKVGLMVVFADLVYVLISKEPARLWDPLGGWVWGAVAASGAEPGQFATAFAQHTAAWWMYLVGGGVVIAAVWAGRRWGLAVASERGERRVAIGLVVALVAIGGLVLLGTPAGKTHSSVLPLAAISQAFAQLGHLGVLAIVGFAIGASLRTATQTLSRVILLFVVSALFYQAWAIAMHGAYRYLLALLLGTIVLDYYLAIWIEQAVTARRRKLLLLVSLVSNLGILCIFKYFDFFTQDVLHLPMKPLQLVLPAGISFHTFQSLSYTIDVYRRELKATRSVTEFATFVLFFPQLVAGPIVRAADLLPQLRTLPSLHPTLAADGAFRIVVGLWKKIALADTLDAVLVARVFAAPAHFSSLETAAAVVGFALQIYLDFSAYSDIAIGSAQLLGFRLPENFDAPYRAANLQEFWRRWHQSLSTWLRDYLYIPLGGGRGPAWFVYRNLLLTMLLGGLWHGASWNFVIWGALHGAGLGVTRWFQRRFDDGALGGRRAVAAAGAWAVVAMAAYFALGRDMRIAIALLWWWVACTPLGAGVTAWWSHTAEAERRTLVAHQTRVHPGQPQLREWWRATMVLAFLATLWALRTQSPAWWGAGAVAVWGSASLSAWADVPRGQRIAMLRIGALRVGAATLVFVYVCAAWIFFRAPTFADAMAMFARLVAGEYDAPNLGPIVRMALGGGLLCHAFPTAPWMWLRAQFIATPAWLRGILLAACALVLRELATPHFVPFIYFQF